MPPGSAQYGTCEQYGGRNERDDHESRRNDHGSDQRRRRKRYGYESATSSTVGDEHTVPIRTLLPARARLLFSIAQPWEAGDVRAPLATVRFAPRCDTSAGRNGSQ